MIEGASCVVLIGGESRRMGTDKAAVKLSGKKLLDHVLEVTTALFEEVLIGAHDDTPLLKSLPSGVRVVKDTLPGRGPALGVCSALEAASNDWLFVVSCDVPMLSAGLVTELSTLIDDAYDAIVPRIGGRPEPTCAFYSKAVLLSLKESVLSGKRGLTYFLKEAEEKGLKIRYVGEEELRRVDPELLSFTDIDTPDDLLGVENYIKEK